MATLSKHRHLISQVVVAMGSLLPLLSAQTSFQEQVTFGLPAPEQASHTIGEIQWATRFLAFEREARSNGLELIAANSFEPGGFRLLAVDEKHLANRSDATIEAAIAKGGRLLHQREFLIVPPAGIHHGGFATQDQVLEVVGQRLEARYVIHIPPSGQDGDSAATLEIVVSIDSSEASELFEGSVNLSE